MLLFCTNPMARTKLLIGATGQLAPVLSFQNVQISMLVHLKMKLGKHLRLRLNFRDEGNPMSMLDFF